MPRKVFCRKYQKEMEGLVVPPFPGPKGQDLFQNVSQQAWQMWQQQSTILINHYGLNMADKRAQQFLREQLEEFFFGPGAAMPEGWIPEDQAPTAPAKGAPGPRKK